MPANVYWKDTNRKFLGCNKNLKHILGEKYAIFLENGNTKVFKSHIAKQIDRTDNQVLEENIELEFEEIGLDINHNEVTYLTRKIPLRNKAGEVTGILGVSIDIEDRKRLERALKKSNKVKQEFIENMSHDLRTPITGILGMFQDLQNMASKMRYELKINPIIALDALQKLIKRTEENTTLGIGAVDGLLNLFNEILEVARLKANVVAMPVISFELKPLVQSILDLLHPTAKEKKLNLCVKIDSDIPPYLYGSASYVIKILLNLVSNALKFTQSGLINLTISVANEANVIKKGCPVELKIMVEDTGIGIPKNKIDKIFDHFSRLNPSCKGVYKGYGLGLYTIKKYIQEMKGSIKVDSVLDKGTIFTVILPFLAEDHSDYIIPSILEKKEHCKCQEECISTLDTSTANTRILIVEDHPMAAMGAKNTLRGCGFKEGIDVVVCGEMAVKYAATYSYNLILMDIGLPDFNGTEATKRIRSLDDPIKSKVPIVALSAHVTEENRGEYIALGMNGSILKPATVVKLTPALERYVFNKKGQNK